MKCPAFSRNTRGCRRALPADGMAAVPQRENRDRLEPGAHFQQRAGNRASQLPPSVEPGQGWQEGRRAPGGR
jgi:hypothetical protein